MNTSTSKEEQSDLKDDLPDAVWKALIEEKTKELNAYLTNNKKLDVELKEKKNEYELWKIKLEAKEKEQQYWIETIQRLEAEQKKLEYKIALVDAGVSSKCKEMAHEEKFEEDQCTKLKALWESSETEWETVPMAINRENAYKKFLQAKFKLSLLQNQLRYQKQMNKIRENIDNRRFQVAVIDFAKASLERRRLENELQSIYETNEELKTNLALLKLENESLCSSKSVDSCFLMPPPVTNLYQKQKDTSDTISVSTVVWEDILLLDNESDRFQQSCNTSCQNEPSSSSTTRKNVEDDKKSPKKDSPIENERPLSRQQSMDLAPANSCDNNLNVSNTDNNKISEIQECSSTVDDNLDRTFVHSPPLVMLAEMNDPADNLNCSISINSAIVNDLCTCSSSTVIEYDNKQKSISEERRNRSFSNTSISPMNSMKSFINDEQMTDINTASTSKTPNKTPKPGPIIKSVENVKHNFEFFRSNFATNAASDMFSAQFTMQPENNVAVEHNPNNNENQNAMDDASETDFEMDRIENRPFSPISDMDTDYDPATSMTSEMTFAKNVGNISPPSMGSKMNFNQLQKSNQTGKSKEKNASEKEPKKMLYNFQNMQNFMGQSGPADFFSTDKKTTLF